MRFIRVSGLGCQIWDFRFKVQGSGFKAQGSRFRVQDSGFGEDAGLNV